MQVSNNSMKVSFEKQSKEKLLNKFVSLMKKIKELKDKNSKYSNLVKINKEVLKELRHKISKKEFTNLEKWLSYY